MKASLVPRWATTRALRNSLRRGRRLRALIVGLLTAALLSTGVKLGVTVVSNEAGRQSLTRLDYAGAQSWFENNLVLNWFEPWIAHYNVGVALYYQDNWWEAEAQFETALPLAPEPRKCTVALNLAWTLEAKGDSLRKRGDGQSATLAWGEAKEVVVKQRCDSEQERDSQQETEDRMQEKMEQQSQDSDKPDDAESEPEKEQQEELAQANREAKELEQQQRDEMTRDAPSGDQRNW